jgi:hypothetical protein
VNKKGVGFGIFLLGLGAIWLLANLNILSFNIFGALFKLWPLIFVVIGINLIFKENGAIKGLTWLAFLIILILYSTFGNVSTPKFNGNWTFNTNSDNATQHVEEPMRTGLKDGSLKVDAGAVQVDVQDESDKLIIVDADQKDVNYDINYNSSGDNVDIDLNNKVPNVIGSAKNKLDIKLNKQVTWDIKMNLGASNGNLDLSGLKLKRLEFDAGAVDYNIKMGGNVPVTEVKMDSGASNFAFDIPKDVGVRVKLDGALNNTNFAELGWNKKGSYYESPNYNDAKSKINIDADIGVSKLRVNYN